MIGPPTQRQHDIASRLVVIPRRFVMLVEYVVERELQLPVAIDLPARAQVGQCIAAQRILVGDVVVRASRDVPARTDTEAPEAAIGIEARAPARPARQFVAIVETV